MKDKSPLMPQEKPSSGPPAESTRQLGTPEEQLRFPELLTGSHPTLREMVRNGDSLTRDRYLLLEHLPDDPPEPYPAELEVMLPEAFKLEPTT